MSPVAKAKAAKKRAAAKVAKANEERAADDARLAEVVKANEKRAADDAREAKPPKRADDTREAKPPKVEENATKRAVRSTREWAQAVRGQGPEERDPATAGSEEARAAREMERWRRGAAENSPPPAAAAAAAAKPAAAPAAQKKPARRRPKSLSKEYTKWDGFEEDSEEDEGPVAGAPALPLASTYGKWDRFDDASDDDDDRPNDLEKLWCPVHNDYHFGACEKCVAARYGAYEPKLEPQPYKPKRDPGDVDAAMDRMESKVKDHARAKDVLHQLKDKIENMPDDEVDIASCLHAIKVAGAYSPKDATIHKLLKPVDECPPKPQGPLPKGK